MSIAFRRAVENDIPVIRELAEKIWRAHYISIISMEQIEYMLDKMYSEKSLKEQLVRQPFTLIMKDGMAAGYYSVSETAPGEHYLHKFYIDNSNQRSGIGSAAMDFLLRSILDGSVIRLQVNRKNVNAINFYFRHGFRIAYAKDFEIGGGYTMDDFVMERQMA
ncbi:MAG: GNAT family N-acetyltransferase [Chitinophagales bacterium]